MIRYILFFISFAANAQVGIGTNEPHPSAVLDIQSENKGILIPQVALQSTNDTITITGTSKKTEQKSAEDTLKNNINTHSISKKKSNKNKKNGK